MNEKAKDINKGIDTFKAIDFKGFISVL